MFKYLIFLILISCVPSGGNITVGPGNQGVFAPAPEVTHLTVSGSQLILDGSNFVGVNYVTLKDHDGWEGKFKVFSATFSQLKSEAINAVTIPMDKALDLILSSAHGQNTFPVTFTLQDNSVTTDHIQDGAVTAAKIPDAEIPVSKLNSFGHFPGHGDVLAWDSTPPGQFMFVPFSGGGGGGGITSIIPGKGIAGQGTNIGPPGGTIAVNTGVTGAPPPIPPAPQQTTIPFFNNNNKIVLDSFTSPAGKIAGINFKDGSYIFDIYNDNGFLDILNEVGTRIFSLDRLGDLKLKNSSVCTQATGCTGAPGSTVTSVTAIAPLGSTGTTNVTINAGAVNTPNNLVQLDGTGGLPAGIKGVVSSVTAGAAINVTPASTGAITVGVKFGSGNAQQWQKNLDTLGNLNANDNYVIIGNGTSFEIQGGDTLLTSIGAQKTNANITNLGNLLPLAGSIIVGTGANWNTSTIPTCAASGNFNFSNGTSFSCSTSTSPLSAGTITAFNQVGLQLKAPGVGTATGELHFLGTNNTNYVGLKAADVTTSNTVWTLPAADGSSGFVLSTDGGGKLSWVDLGSGNNVSGIAPSADKAIARWNGNTGKIIQNSGVIIDDLNNILGVAAFTSTGTMTVDTNTFFVDSAGDRVGIGKTNPAYKLDITGAANSGIHLKQAADSTATSGAFFNGLVLEKSSSANAYALGYGTSDLFSIDNLNVGVYTNLFTLNASGNGVIKGSLKVGAYTLPSTDGTSTQALTTNGSGVLSWTNVGGTSDVSNPATSTTGTLAAFSDNSGKIIQDSGVVAANVVTMNPAAGSANRILTSQGANRIATPTSVLINGSGDVSGVGNFTSTGTLSNTGGLTNTGNMTVDTNTLFVDATNDRVGIGTASPATSAILDLTSTNKGLLIPRMTTAQRGTITGPVDGLMIYNTDTKSFDGRADGLWKPVGGGSGNVQTGTSYTLATSDCGNTVSLSNTNPITLNLAALPGGCVVNLIQANTGVVTVVTGGGLTRQNAFGLYRTRTQFSVISIQVDGSNAVISGDVN